MFSQAVDYWAIAQFIYYNDLLVVLHITGSEKLLLNLSQQIHVYFNM